MSANGHKATEVGILPEDWQCVALGSIASLYQPTTISARQLKPDGFPVYGANGIVGFYDKSNHDTEQVTITCRGSTCGVVNRTVERCWITGNAMVANVDANKGINKRFFYHLLSAQDFSVCITGSGQPQIVRGPLANFMVAIPPLIEQDEIAKALDGIDNLIASLDALVAKKRDIKQAAMQQLLTSKTRLPGFTREWRQSTLGDVLRVRHGRDQKAIQCDDGHFPILATGGEIGRTNTPLYTRPSVLIGRKGTIDRPQFMDQPFWTVDTLFYTEIQGLNSALYLFYVFQTVDWRSYNEASGVPSLSSKTIEAIPVNLPEPDEQAAIAATLADFDREIDGLKQRSSKFRAVREGMMQQLLNGRIRLI